MQSANFASLAENIRDWASVVKSLTRLAKDARDDMKAKADKASWSGVNATVSREFIGKTAVEFSDAVLQATSIHDLLNDTRDQLIEQRKQLIAAVDEAVKNNIYITAQGKAIVTVPSGAAAGDAKIPQPKEEELGVAERNIARILAQADEVDRIADRALRSLAKGKYGFSDQGPTSLKEADRRQGQEDAAKWSKKIAQGDVDKWSDKELAAFNETLENQHDNPAFTETLATTLGPDGTLQFWRDLSDPGQGRTPEGDRAKLLGQVQDNLSMSLANATHSRTPEMEAWKKGVIADGGKQFGHEGVLLKPFGFQIMSSLMGKGDFDTKFLDSYGNKLVNFERDYTEHSGRADEGGLWGQTLRNSQLNYPPNPDGVNDPMAGFMEALGHNPEASLEFFDDSTGTGDDRLSNFDYLISDDDSARKWPTDEGQKKDLYGSVGHALESATRGVPYDSDALPGKHSAASALLVQEIVNKMGSDPKLIDEYPMSTSLGNITAEYMRDVQDGLNGERVLPTFGSNAMLGEDPAALHNFLAGVGRDPDAYGAILNSQQAVTTELINETFVNREKYDELSAEVADMVAPGGEISGIMAESRAQAVYDEKIKSDTDFNEGINRADKWVGFAIDKGIGKIPVGGDIVSSVTGEIREAVVAHYTRDSSEDAAMDKGEFLAQQRKGSAGAAYDATHEAARLAGISSPNADSLANTASNAVHDSYGQGRQ
ncbi:hypothetical protein QR77_14055 [Streptomyces sp. 150FB]|nr:hypothetical protein QR77_14055 [Streptomyces sp. 150FB]